MVFGLDAFLNIEGLDLNGDGVLGTSAQFSFFDPLPPGLTFDFSSSLSPDLSDLTLTYTFSNSTATQIFPNVAFFSFLDGDIADFDIRKIFETLTPQELLEISLNDFGEASGILGSGASDSDPDFWEISKMPEEEYFFNEIFEHLLLGSLNNSNALSQTSLNDVSMALGFELGDLVPLETATIEIFLSEDRDSIGNFFLTQEDLDPNSFTSITMSGQSSVKQNPIPPIPEPPTWLLLTAGLAALKLSWQLKMDSTNPTL
ncbi:hypothetical protein HW44_09830 [Nitrosococcus oceani]|nr:hypothetical protein HW44_09830 [Nitrosococcus oceani]